MPTYGMVNIIRRVKDMTITFKEGINPQSVIVKHGILTQAATLIMGREGVLETEKELYLMLAMIDFVSEEDIIAECNEDKRDLVTIMAEDIEPKFFELVSDSEWNNMYQDMRRIHLNRCQEIWDNQHSVVGIVDMLLEIMTSMDETNKKDILKDTAKLAEQLYQKRTEEINDKMDKANSKLEQFVRSYQEKEGQNNA